MKNIPNYNNKYSITKSGAVVNNNTGRVLKQQTHKQGYKRVTLYKDGIGKTIKICHLMGVTYLGFVPNGRVCVVDHIDNDKSNNRLDNLQVISNRENLTKDKMRGKSKYVGVSWHKAASKWVSQIYNNKQRVYLGLFNCELAAAKAYQDKLKEINENL